MAILLGLGTALLLEAMDRSLKNIEEAQLLLDLPLLGTVPLIARVANKSTNKSIGDGDRNSPLTEQSQAVTNSFEIIHTNLNFTLPDKKLQVVLVTSATSGEGKSFTTANLATVMAARGMRVLLIDADMRRPRQVLTRARIRQSWAH